MSVSLRSLNVSLITHLHSLLLTCAFSSAYWATQQLVTLPLTDCLFDWLTDCLSACLSPLLLAAALGIVLTSGCATSRHCQQQELPGVRIHCCDSDLCNSAPSRHSARSLPCACALLLCLWLLRPWLWEYARYNSSGLEGMIFTFDLILFIFVLETFSCTPLGLDGSCGGLAALLVDAGERIALRGPTMSRYPAECFWQSAGKDSVKNLCTSTHSSLATRSNWILTASIISFHLHR